jgi:Zn-dependent protease
MAQTGGRPARRDMSALPIGTYHGVPVRAHWSLLFTALLVAEILASGVLPSTAPHHATGAYWAAGAVGSVVFLASVLAHELMHAVAARHYGVRVDRITLWLLGGMAEIKGDPPTPRAAAVIAGAGPAASIGVGALFSLGAWGGDALGLPDLFTATLLWLGVTNGILGVFNLLPGAPLDGGRLLQAALWHRYRDSYRATVVATRVGRQLGIGLVTLGLLEALWFDVVGGLWLALIGWFLVSAARAESAGAMLRAVLPDMTIGQLMRPLPTPVPAWWTTAHLREMRELPELLHEILPVVDFDGRGIGIISWRDVAARGDARHDEATLGTLCRRLPVLPAQTSALDAMRDGAFARGAVLVQDANGVFGLVSAADLEHAAALGPRFQHH